MPIPPKIMEEADRNLRPTAFLSDGFAHNRRKAPLCLCVDASYSMADTTEYGESKAALLKKGVNKLIRDLKNDAETGSLIDLCILTFNGDGVQEYGEQGFTPVSSVEEQFDFEPFGSSPLFTAANTALDMLLRQIELYRKNRVVSDKGWLIVFSDGQADDGVGGEISFEGLRSRFSDREIQKKINVMCGCFGYHYDNLEAVAVRSSIKNMLEENNFVGYIQSLSHSIQVQSRPVADGQS